MTPPSSARLSDFAVRAAALLLLTLTAGCWVTTEQGNLIRRDLEDLNKRLDSVEKTLESDRARLTDAVSAAEGDLKRLDEILKAATKLLAREGAGVAVRVDNLESDVGSLTGATEEAHVQLDVLRDDFLSAVDRLDTLEKALREIGAKMDEVAAKPRWPEDPDDLFALAMKRVKAGASAEGREMLREYTKRAPKGPHTEEARFHIGESYLAEAEWEKAIRDLKSFIEEYPDSDMVPEGWFGIGQSLYELGDCKRAELFMAKVETDYKKHAAAKKAKALIKTIKGKGRKKCVD